MTKYVQISNDKVITEFFCEQDPSDKPGYAEIEDDDPRYLDFVNPPWSPNKILDEVRAARLPAIAILSQIAGRAFRAGDTGTADAADACADALTNMTQSAAVKAATDDASLKAALVADYLAIAEAAPSSIQAAFAEFRL